MTSLRLSRLICLLLRWEGTFATSQVFKEHPPHFKASTHVRVSMCCVVGNITYAPVRAAHSSSPYIHLDKLQPAQNRSPLILTTVGNMLIWASTQSLHVLSFALIHFLVETFVQRAGLLELGVWNTAQHGCSQRCVELFVSCLYSPFGAV